MGKRIVTFLVVAMAMGVMAETVNTVTKFNQSYPYTGRATVEYTVGGTLPANAVAKITITTDNAIAIFTPCGTPTSAPTAPAPRLPLCFSPL
jgi:hypothetical protein